MLHVGPGEITFGTAEAIGLIRRNLRVFASRSPYNAINGAAAIVSA